MGVIAKGIPRGCQGLFTLVSLGYPLSVFNKNSTLNEMSKFKLNLRSWMCILSYSSFVCISAYANIYFQTTFNQHSCVRGPLREGVPSDSVRRFRASLLLRTTCCNSAVIGLLVVWRYNKQQPKKPGRLIHK